MKALRHAESLAAASGTLFSMAGSRSGGSVLECGRLGCLQLGLPLPEPFSSLLLSSDTHTHASEWPPAAVALRCAPPMLCLCGTPPRRLARASLGNGAGRKARVEHLQSHQEIVARPPVRAVAAPATTTRRRCGQSGDTRGRAADDRQAEPHVEQQLAWRKFCCV